MKSARLKCTGTGASAGASAPRLATPKRVCRAARRAAGRASPDGSDSPTSASGSGVAPLAPARWLARAAAAAAAAALLAGAPGVAHAGAGAGDDFSLPYAATVVQGNSSARAVALAARLKAEGARMVRTGLQPAPRAAPLSRGAVERPDQTLPAHPPRSSPSVPAPQYGAFWCSHW